jgi:hypothetical protein
MVLQAQLELQVKVHLKAKMIVVFVTYSHVIRVSRSWHKLLTQQTEVPAY